MKRVIITGVSEGLGYETAKVLLTKWVEVIGISRNKPDIDIIHLKTDLTSKSDIESTIQQIIMNYREFDALIHCAWILTVEHLNEIDSDKLEKLFSVNVFAPMLLTSGLFDVIKNNHADIVNVSSTVWLKAYENQCAYGASKWALRGITENLQLEFKGTKTRVIWFHPGGFQSRIFEKATGIKNDLENFMKAEDVAKALVSTLELPKNMEVSYIVINRK